MLDRTAEPWPPVDYKDEFRRRFQRLMKLRKRPELWDGALEYYRTRPVEFINHWCCTYDPRLAGTEIPALLPFALFRRQRELVEFIYGCLEERAHGLIEKSRDMGATWVCAAVSVHMWLFLPGASIGWGSRKAMLVDQLGNPDSIFEKMRMIIQGLPPEMMPLGFKRQEHLSMMRILNPQTGASIIGEAGDDIGRGGRSLVVFKDESGHYEHPEKIEAALLANAAIQMDISSVPVHSTGTVFQRRREGGVEWRPGTAPIKDRINVFVMDWRDHPAKTQAWYDALRQRMVDEGMLHVLAAEVDRDYSAAVQGTIIPAAWVRSSIDAHVKLKFKGDGPWIAGLDVADEGTDTNALAKRKGSVLYHLAEWGERDTGRTARRAVDACSSTVPIHIQYDAVGVGSAVKAETNRLGDERLLPRGMRLVPWNAGAGPQNPDKRVVEYDRDSPLNKDFYANLKAQGWWQLRRRFELTHRAITDEQFTWDEDDLISLPSNLPLLWKLVKELSQPTITHTSAMKLLIEKTPEGARSPNLADAVMMAFWPIKAGGPLQISDELLRKVSAR